MVRALGCQISSECLCSKKFDLPFNYFSDFFIQKDVQCFLSYIGFIYSHRRSFPLQGILSGVAYYTMGVVTRERGPVFFSAFNPLSTVVVAIVGSLVLAEQMYLGRLAFITKL